MLLFAAVWRRVALAAFRLPAATLPQTYSDLAPDLFTKTALQVMEDLRVARPDDQLPLPQDTFFICLPSHHLLPGFLLDSLFSLFLLPLQLPQGLDFGLLHGSVPYSAHTLLPGFKGPQLPGSCVQPVLPALQAHASSCLFVPLLGMADRLSNSSSPHPPHTPLQLPTSLDGNSILPVAQAREPSVCFLFFTLHFQSR